MEIFVNIITILTWCALVLVKALPLDKFYISDFQARRLKHDMVGDHRFRLSTERGKLKVLLDMKLVGLALVFGLLLVWHRPGWAALLLGVIGLFLVFLLSSFQLIQNLSEKLLILASKPALKIASYFAPLLDALSHKSSLPAFSDRAELIDLIRHNHNKLNKSQTALTVRLLSLVDKKVSEAMTKRAKVMKVKADDLLSPKLVDHLHASGLSQFPVCQDTLDSPVGTLVLADISDVKVLSRSPKVESLMRPSVFYINIDDDLETALQAFIETGANQFLVVDPERKIRGLITLADIFSEVFSDNLDRQFDDLEATSELGVITEEMAEEMTREVAD